ncbi:hypothetical protein [Neotamlana sedimentorum]|nr:hypothetical protein [Tamlana sedimentorum]
MAKKDDASIGAMGKRTKNVFLQLILRAETKPKILSANSRELKAKSQNNE